MAMSDANADRRSSIVQQSSTGNQVLRCRSRAGPSCSTCTMTDPEHSNCYRDMLPLSWWLDEVVLERSVSIWDMISRSTAGACLL